ncbi:SPFH domain-containing protein [Dialister sp.]|uniref:SPFH domain-containing protein n=1 Tax=Dialister sp. TaxID=1955814 RepID=UPI002E814A74|nr:SPFH domain-containing protein [Dialister sp.]MEE3452680.1 SPFH domain-containing protein [Dialister sp.]
MGLIKAGIGAIGGVLADQWKEFFYCDSMTPDILMMKGEKKISRFSRSSNTGGEDNIISNGSKIAVNNGQCMMIVESGKVVDLCAEPGEYTYDKSTEPSIFTGSLGDGVKEIFHQIGRRFTFGGDTGKDQRVYYFNLKEIVGNKYGTPAEVPFKVSDQATGLNLLVRIRCFGEYSYKITNPILFYTNVAGNVADTYDRKMLDSQLKSELLTALQPAFAKLSAQHIDYAELPGHTFEMADALNEVLSKKWRDLRGIEIVSFGMNSVKANEEDEAKIQKMQMGAAMSRPDIAMGALADATTDAMRTAAGNEGNMGAAVGFMGMNMAGNAGSGMYQAMAEQAEKARAEYQAQQKKTSGWTCPACGAEGNTGKFCSNCGKPKPEEKKPWDCPSCGQKGNTGNFCANCGAPRPTGWTCPSCGTMNQGKFCTNCGTKKP